MAIRAVDSTWLVSDTTIDASRLHPAQAAATPSRVPHVPPTLTATMPRYQRPDCLCCPMALTTAASDRGGGRTQIKPVRRGDGRRRRRRRPRLGAPRATTGTTTTTRTSPTPPPRAPSATVANCCSSGAEQALVRP
ncbi:hypothetical protein BS78_06G204600 [Paspalum vaginatum]|nr:hypothetical protein BS78_06G204600 [Paspalum vaginatum]